MYVCLYNTSHIYIRVCVRVFEYIRKSSEGELQCVLQGVAGVLQCVAVCCSVLQCVAVCCLSIYVNQARVSYLSTNTRIQTHRQNKFVKSSHEFVDLQMSSWIYLRH